MAQSFLHFFQAVSLPCLYDTRKRHHLVCHGCDTGLGLAVLVNLSFAVRQYPHIALQDLNIFTLQGNQYLYVAVSEAIKLLHRRYSYLLHGPSGFIPFEKT